MARRRRWSGWGGLLLGPALAVGAAGVVLALDRDTGIVPLIRFVEETRRAEARLTELEAERVRLRDRVRTLRTDPLAIEAVAREQFGMVRPGELLIRFGDAGREDD